METSSFHRGLGVITTPITIYETVARYAPCSKKGLVTALNLPLEYDVKSKLLPARDQGDAKNSPAHVCACMAEYLDYVDGSTKRCLSVDYIYHNRCHSTEGMVSLDALSALHHYGTCSDILYPICAPSPSHEAIGRSRTFAKRHFNEGKTRFIAHISKEPNSGYHELINLKHAIYNQGVVYMVLPVFNYDPKFWWPSVSYSQIGHQAVAVVGWTCSGFIIRNSWGRSWGDEGYALYSYGDFVRGRHTDLLTLVNTDDEDLCYLPLTEDKSCCTLS